MNAFWTSLFFGAGAATVAYVQLGKRVGYNNQQQVLILVGASFVVCTFVFFTIFRVVLGFH